ncbi:uncharacterized protein PFD1115c-like [Procambarus clarkii]|uniref:uncharacterized protein PFD1115c-like n=1 Tax=Procambarus clarkii TaxID=6728 RepID=UPI003742DD76
MAQPDIREIWQRPAGNANGIQQRPALNERGIWQRPAGNASINTEPKDPGAKAALEAAAMKAATSQKPAKCTEQMLERKIPFIVEGVQKPERSSREARRRRDRATMTEILEGLNMEEANGNIEKVFRLGIYKKERKRLIKEDEHTLFIYQDKSIIIQDRTDPRCIKLLVISNIESKATGDERKATGDESNATGNESKASGDESKATGDESKATGDESNATGNESKASGDESKATGDESKATGEECEATGEECEATEDESKATGDESKAIGDESKETGD